MKKFLSLGLILSLMIGFTACTSNTGSDLSLKMGRVEYPAHGDKSFAVTVVAMNGDKIAGVSIDEYQFMGTDTTTPVPNSDGGFGENYADPKVALVSKLTNNDVYSKNMADKADATMKIADGWKKIEDFAVGKTIAELETILSDNDNEGMIDTVSSVTLVDTKGYVESILEAAKKAK